MRFAAAGQVLASIEVTHLARKIDGIKYVDRGRTQFKGIDEPTQVVRVVPDAPFRISEADRRVSPPLALTADCADARGYSTGSIWSELLFLKHPRSFAKSAVSQLPPSTDSVVNRPRTNSHGSH